MDLYRINRKLLIKHIIVWLILETILQILSPLPGSIPIMIISGLIILVNTMFTFYFLGLYILPKYWGNYFYLPLGILFSYIIYCLFYYVIGYYILPAIGGGSNKAKGTFFEFLNNTLLLYLLITTCTSAFYLNRRSIYSLKEHSDKEKQLISKELSLLKGQFNNHLTFNFLNFCYSHIHKNSETVTASIELFSDMLRITLLPAIEKIPLQQEVDYIKNFIKLQKIICTSFNVNFFCNGNISDWFIVPRLLVSFIDENLKNFDFKSNGEPVVIELNSNHEKLFLRICFSQKHMKNNQILEGSNTRKVFDLFYTDKYEIKEEQLSEQYIKELTLYYKLTHKIF